MIKRTILVFTLFYSISFAQVAQPNLPVNFVIDFGYLTPTGNTGDLEGQFWGSTVTNLYFTYDYQLGDSRFYLVPGAGIAHERYRFQNNNTIADAETGTIIGPADSLYGITPFINNNKLFVNFADVPFEIQWRMNKERPENGLRIAIGGKVGYRIRSQVKFSFLEEDVSKTYTFNEGFDLNQLRYGAYARIGFGGWNIFYYQTLSPLWQDLDAPAGAAGMYQFTIGTSISLF